MKVVIAPDSFKESLAAPEVAQAIAAGWQAGWPGCEIYLQPMADGGEGTVDAVLAAVGGERRILPVRGPLGETIEAHWGLLADGRAVIEMAAASGLHRVAPGRRDPARTSSFGTGELLRAALDAGAREVFLGLGGSATNDGGGGMLQALGARLLDGQVRELEGGGAALSRLQTLDLTTLDPRLRQIKLTLAADVDNPLCGAKGASRIFGPQKGANPAQVEQLDQALNRFADVVAQTLGQDHRDVPGVGAAGGMGFAALAVLGASFERGVELVAGVSRLAEAVQGADLVITGEGRLDAQSLFGKTPMGVARIAQAAGVPVVVLAGSLGDDYQQLYDAGIDAAFSLVPGPMTLEQALTDTPDLLRQRACDLARLWRTARGLS